MRELCFDRYQPDGSYPIEAAGGARWGDAGEVAASDTASEMRRGFVFIATSPSMELGHCSSRSLANATTSLFAFCGSVSVFCRVPGKYD
jgi:hypothetical protein